MSSAATTLDDIITELKLTYDSLVGILEGDAVREIPSLNVLLNLNKLVAKLAKELDAVEHVDENVLEIINDKLGLHEKRPLEDDEEIPLAKRRKPEVKVEEEEKEQVNSKDDPVPPVQQGSFTHDNDTRLKNPKSEFVTAQTLPAEAIAELGLYSEDANGLEPHGKEYLRKKYGVASYPERDLQDLLPGTIPNIDFSKNKAPTNQVQFTTFQTYIELYFRPFASEDLSFCAEKNVLPPAFSGLDYDASVTPFLIPKLGPFYADVWLEEDATLASKLNSPAYQQPLLEAFKPKGTIDNLSDDKLYTEDVSCGPLLSRLLSAVLSINEAEIERKDDDDEVATKLDTTEDYKVTAELLDYLTIEERLKRELKYIGIFMNLPRDKERLSDERGLIIDSDDWIRNKEDDEVCTEIRELQAELRDVNARNRSRKKKLLPIIEEQIAYQEYCTILEDLDKQVDLAYIKRLKAKNKKKKIHQDATPQQQAANNGLRALLDKRRRWIDNIGRLFRPAEIMKRVPSESIFKGEENNSDDDDNDDVDDDDVLPA